MFPNFTIAHYNRLRKQVRGEECLQNELTDRNDKRASMDKGPHLPDTCLGKAGPARTGEAARGALWLPIASPPPPLTVLPR